MSERGVHFAVTPAQARALQSATSDRKLMSLVDAIEAAWEEPYVVESDKAWDAIHRCLTDGTLLYVSGNYPLNLCICGGEQLHRGRAYTVSFVSARRVKAVAKALANVTKKWLRQQYALIDPEDYEFELDEEDFAYTWASFLEVRRFYRRAASADRAVIFTVGS